MGNGQFGIYFIGSGGASGTKKDTDSKTGSACSSRAISRDYERVLYKVGRYPYSPDSVPSTPIDTPNAASFAMRGSPGMIGTTTGGVLLGTRPLSLTLPQRYDSNTSLGRQNDFSLGRNLGRSYNRVFKHYDDFQLNYKENYVNSKPLFPSKVGKPFDNPFRDCDCDAGCVSEKNDNESSENGIRPAPQCTPTKFLTSNAHSLKGADDCSTNTDFCESVLLPGSNLCPRPCCRGLPIPSCSPTSFMKGCQTDRSPWILHENLHNGKLMVVTRKCASIRCRPATPLTLVPDPITIRPTSPLQDNIPPRPVSPTPNFDRVTIFSSRRNTERSTTKGAQTNPNPSLEDFNRPDIETFGFNPYDSTTLIDNYPNLLEGTSLHNAPVGNQTHISKDNGKKVTDNEGKQLLTPGNKPNTPLVGDGAGNGSPGSRKRSESPGPGHGNQNGGPNNETVPRQSHSTPNTKSGLTNKPKNKVGGRHSSTNVGSENDKLVSKPENSKPSRNSVDLDHIPRVGSGNLPPTTSPNKLPPLNSRAETPPQNQSVNVSNNKGRVTPAPPSGQQNNRVESPQGFNEPHRASSPSTVGIHWNFTNKPNTQHNPAIKFATPGSPTNQNQQRPASPVEEPLVTPRSTDKPKGILRDPQPKSGGDPYNLPPLSRQIKPFASDAHDVVNDALTSHKTPGSVPGRSPNKPNNLKSTHPSATVISGPGNDGLRRYPSQHSPSSEGPIFMARKHSINQLKESLSRQNQPGGDKGKSPDSRKSTREVRSDLGKAPLTIPSSLSLAKLLQGEVKVIPRSKTKEELLDAEKDGGLVSDYVLLPPGSPSRSRRASSLKRSSTVKPPSRNAESGAKRTRSVHFKGVPPQTPPTP